MLLKVIDIGQDINGYGFVQLNFSKGMGREDMTRLSYCKNHHKATVFYIHFELENGH